MTDVIAVVADCHIGSTVGLVTPNVTLDDGGTYTASKGQRWLWRSWLDFVSQVQGVSAKHGGAPITVIFNGDMVEGDSKNRSKQLITRNRANILSMAAETIKPLVDISTRAFFMRGTGAHVGKSAELEEELAKDCTIAEKNGECSSWWSWYGEIGGVLFDVAHHGRVGGQPWTKANPLGTLAVRLILAYAGQRLPQVAIRSHYHRYASTFDAFPIMVIATPAWQLATEYVNRIGAIEPADIGGLIFVCDKGEFNWAKVIYKPEPPRPWKASQKRTSGQK